MPGHSGESKLITYVTGGDEDRVMPPKGDRLTAGQIEILRAWIDQGASWPDEADAGHTAAAESWSLRPLVKPPVPAGTNASWVRTPIDAFVLARLEQKAFWRP